MALQRLKKGGRQKKTRMLKKKGGLRKTRKHGGGLLSLFGTASRMGVGVRNIKYKDTLENRLVNKYNDYEWVQERRTKNMLPRKNKSDYTENNWTGDTPPSTEEKKKGWFW